MLCFTYNDDFVFLVSSIINSLFVVRNANDTAYHCNFVIFIKLRGEMDLEETAECFGNLELFKLSSVLH